MSNDIPLSYISETDASATSEESLAIFMGILKEDQFPDWIMYTSLLHDGVEDIATTFVNLHACITVQDVFGEDFITYSPTPLHVCRTQTNEIVDGKVVTCILEGLLYSNGAVFLLHRPDFLLTLLWIDKKTIEAFDYPEPTIKEEYLPS